MKPYDTVSVDAWHQYKKFVTDRHDEYNTNGHWHHVIPRCLGGNDEHDNMVRLSVKDHQMAHLMLAECFPAGTDAYLYNLWSAKLLGATIPPNLRCGENNPFFGRTHTDEVKRASAQRNKDTLTGVSYEQRYGSAAEAERIKRRDAVQRMHNNRTAEEKQSVADNMRIASLSKFSAEERAARARRAALAKYSPVTVNGVVFDSLSAACKYFDVTKYFLYKNYTVEKNK